MRQNDTSLKAVLDAIDKIAVGEYATFSGRLVADEDSQAAVSAQALLNAKMRRAIEARFAMRFDVFDVRAIHSIWMKWYLNRFLPPVLLADLILKQSLPVSLQTSKFLVGDDARIATIALSGYSVSTEKVDPFDRFAPLIFGHFKPLIEMWALRTDVTPRVFWSNLGNTFEAMLRKVESVSGRSERIAEAQRLLDEPRWGQALNPIYDAVYYVQESGERVRRRRVCCVQFLLPDRRFCKACPIEEARTTRAVGGSGSN